MSEHTAEAERPDDMYWCFDSDALNRAAGHGCLDEDVEAGSPLACAGCLSTPPGASS